jgi:hypothetical protein
MPSTWSPSTTWPSASAAMHRSASPSSAMPMAAPSSRTVSASEAGSVAPQPRLMLSPRLVVDQVTRAPVAQD